MLSSKRGGCTAPAPAARRLDQLAGPGADLLIAFENHLPLAQRMRAGLGEADILGRAVKQLCAERPFEPGHVFRDCCFGNAQSTRGAGEAAIASDLDEYLDATKTIHRYAPVSIFETIKVFQYHIGALWRPAQYIEKHKQNRRFCGLCFVKSLDLRIHIWQLRNNSLMAARCEHACQDGAQSAPVH